MDAAITLDSQHGPDFPTTARALLTADCDFVLAPAAALPGTLPHGLHLAAVLARRETAEALVSRGSALAELPAGARVAVMAPRQRAQLLAYRADLDIVAWVEPVHAAVAAVEAGGLDALIASAAELEWLGCAERVRERLSPRAFVGAPGQGAVALLVRAEDTALEHLLAHLNEEDARLEVEAERALAHALSPGPGVAFGALARAHPGNLLLSAMVALPNGTHLVWQSMPGHRDDPRGLGLRLAALLRQAADEELTKRLL